jgi:hypothetical protein
MGLKVVKENEGITKSGKQRSAEASAIQKMANSQLKFIEQAEKRDAQLRAEVAKGLDIRKDDEGFVRSLYNNIPTNIRLLVENMVGVDTPITAKDFTKEELIEIAFLAEKQKRLNIKREKRLEKRLEADLAKRSEADKAYSERLQKDYIDLTEPIDIDDTKKMLASYRKTRGKTSVNPYVQNQQKVVDLDYTDSFKRTFTDPTYRVATSLGKYNLYDLNDKALRVKDKYNFNKKERNLPTNFRNALAMMMASPELAGEYLANFLSTEDREVDIIIPKKRTVAPVQQVASQMFKGGVEVRREQRKGKTETQKMLEAKKTKEGLKEIGDITTDFIPGVSEAKDITSLGKNLKKGDYIGAGIDATSLALGAVPVLGDIARRGFKTLVKGRFDYMGDDVFHSTTKDFKEFGFVSKNNEADIGFHVGTKNQAKSRIIDPETGEVNVNHKLGARTIPLKLLTDLKPARIPDISSFKEPSTWLRELAVSPNEVESMGLFRVMKSTPEGKRALEKSPKLKIGDTVYYMNPDAMELGMDKNLWKDLVLEATRAKRLKLDTTNNFQDRKEWFEAIKRAAKKNNYDSYVYANEYEGAIFNPRTGGMDYEDSYMLLETNQAKGKFAKTMTKDKPDFMKNQGGLLA